MQARPVYSSSCMDLNFNQRDVGVSLLQCAHYRLPNRMAFKETLALNKARHTYLLAILNFRLPSIVETLRCFQTMSRLLRPQGRPTILDMKK